jgi:hypothetical protein
LVASDACDAIHVLPIRLEGARVEGDSLGEVRGIAVRISDDIRRAVVFFGVPTERSPIEYGGTGFLAAFKAGTPFPFTYLITARHVATALQQHEDTGFHIRANIKDGESVAVPITDKVNWSFHPDTTVDLAAVPFGFPLDFRADHIFYLISDKNCVCDYNDVACGDICNLIGLFRLHAGSKRNVPIVHTGNLAMLPDPNERIPLRDRMTDKIIETESYLIEAQTLEGLSGGPVFVHQVIDLIVPTLEEVPNDPNTVKHNPKVIGVVKLLGLYTGAWDGEPGKILEADRNLKGGTGCPSEWGQLCRRRK